MSLPIQSYRLNEVAEAGLSVDGPVANVAGFGNRAVRVVGHCFAFEREVLADEAKDRGLPWHEWLLRRSVAGLWEEGSPQKVYVCYTLHPNLVRVFFCSHQKEYPEKFCDTMCATPGYIESGRDGFPVGYERSMAYWEAPGTAVALWPRGLYGETEGARIVYPVNGMIYCSYPEAEHDDENAAEKAGPEYIRVPQQELVAFNTGGGIYHYLNRWDAGDKDLRLKLF